MCGISPEIAMTTMRKELGRLSSTLLWRGVAFTTLGAAALIWPEPILVGALLVVSLLATLLGLYEMTIAASIRRRTSRWWLVLTHGILSLGFGLLSVGAAALPLRYALAVVMAWLIAYAGVAMSAAVILRPRRRIRVALFAWGALNVALAFVVVMYPAVTIFSFLFFGAVYAALYGIWQIAAGVCLRRTIDGLHNRAGLAEPIVSHIGRTLWPELAGRK
jgi:uncharacterized membrane protein HdeD (DUF308 family)